MTYLNKWIEIDDSDCYLQETENGYRITVYQGDKTYTPNELFTSPALAMLAIRDYLGIADRTKKTSLIALVSLMKDV